VLWNVYQKRPHYICLRRNDPNFGATIAAIDKVNHLDLLQRMTSKDISELGPIHPDSVPDPEKENKAPWIVRKLTGVRDDITSGFSRLIYSGSEHDR
jgi:hypothetical protein